MFNNYHNYADRFSERINNYINEINSYLIIYDIDSLTYFLHTCLSGFLENFPKVRAKLLKLKFMVMFINKDLNYLELYTETILNFINGNFDKRTAQQKLNFYEGILNNATYLSVQYLNFEMTIFVERIAKLLLIYEKEKVKYLNEFEFDEDAIDTIIQNFNSTGLHAINVSGIDNDDCVVEYNNDLNYHMNQEIDCLNNMTCLSNLNDNDNEKLDSVRKPSCQMEEEIAGNKFKGNNLNCSYMNNIYIKGNNNNNINNNTNYSNQTNQMLQMDNTPKIFSTSKLSKQSKQSKHSKFSNTLNTLSLISNPINLTNPTNKTNTKINCGMSVTSKKTYTTTNTNNTNNTTNTVNTINKYTRLFAPKYDKKENIDKKIIRRFRDFLKSQEKNILSDDSIDRHFFYYFIHCKGFPKEFKYIAPVNCLPEDSNNIITNSVGNNFLFNLFEKRGSKELFRRFLEESSDAVVNDLIKTDKKGGMKLKITEEAFNEIKSYLFKFSTIYSWKNFQDSNYDIKVDVNKSYLDDEFKNYEKEDLNDLVRDIDNRHLNLNENEVDNNEADNNDQDPFDEIGYLNNPTNPTISSHPSNQPIQDVYKLNLINSQSRYLYSEFTHDLAADLHYNGQERRDDSFNIFDDRERDYRIDEKEGGLNSSDDPNNRFYEMREDLIYEVYPDQAVNSANYNGNFDNESAEPQNDAIEGENNHHHHSSNNSNNHNNA